MKIRSAIIAALFTGLMAFGDIHCPWIPSPDRCQDGISFDDVLKAQPAPC